MNKPLRVLLLRVGPAGVAFRAPGPPVVAPPIGLLLIAAALQEAHGDAVSVELVHSSVDLHAWTDLRALLRRVRPHLVGLSALTIDESRLAVCARYISKVLPRCPVLVGGPHATTNPSRVLALEGVDAVVVGEGEHTMVELVGHALRGTSWREVPGVATSTADGIQHVPRPYIDDLDSLPLPAWGHVDLDTYSGLYNIHELPPIAPRYAPVITSRGCPWSCVYCHGMFGRKVRAHSAARVLEELRMLKEVHGVGEIHIVDDIFNLDGERLEAICDGLIKADLGLHIAFPNGLRGDIITERQMEKLRDAGCYSIAFALETATPRLQKLIRKNLKVDRVLKNAQLASKLGLITSCFVMLGFPTETEEEARHTVQVVADSAFDLPKLFKVCPFPGTDIFDLAVAHGFKPQDRGGELFDYDKGMINISAMSDEVLTQVVEDAREQVLAAPHRLQRLEAILDRFPPHPIFDTSSWRNVRERLGRGPLHR